METQVNLKATKPKLNIEEVWKMSDDDIDASSAFAKEDGSFDFDLEDKIMKYVNEAAEQAADLTVKDSKLNPTARALRNSLKLIKSGRPYARKLAKEKSKTDEWSDSNLKSYLRRGYCALSCFESEELDGLEMLAGDVFAHMNKYLASGLKLLIELSADNWPNLKPDEYLQYFYNLSCDMADDPDYWNEFNPVTLDNYRDWTFI